MSEEKTTSFAFASNTLPLPQSKDLLEPAIQMICIGICRVSFFSFVALVLYTFFPIVV